MKPEDRSVIRKALITHDRELQRVAVTEAYLLPEDALTAIAKERAAVERILDDIHNAMRAERIEDQLGTAQQEGT